MFHSVLARLANALDEHDLPYMVIGGQAVLLYGEPRATKDIDVTLGAGPERIGDVMRVVRSCAFDVLTASPEEFVSETFVLPCKDETSGIRIDFIFSISPYEKLAIKRSRAIRIDDADVHYAAPEDVIIHKVVAGRPRDLDDARSIIQKQAGLDIDDIREWLVQFEEALGQPLTNRFEELLAEVSGPEVS